MNVSDSLYTLLTLGSIITTGALTINLTENFGTLAKNGDIKQQISGSNLVGSYGNALTAMSLTTIVLCAIYLVVFIWGILKLRNKTDSKISKMILSSMLLIVLTGIASSALALNLTENFISVEGIETSPNFPSNGENYKLRGTYGKATLGMACTSTGLASLGLLSMLGLGIMSFSGKSSVKVFDKELDFNI
jgi:hypothetical protein